MFEISAQYLSQVAFALGFVLLLIIIVFGVLKRFRFQGFLMRRSFANDKRGTFEIECAKAIDASSKIIVLKYNHKRYLLALNTSGTTILSCDAVDESSHKVNDQ